VEVAIGADLEIPNTRDCKFRFWSISGFEEFSKASVVGFNLNPFDKMFFFHRMSHGAGFIIAKSLYTGEDKC
jgi:hypothetical protein